MIVDLRSDTVTRPSAAMRDAMMAAPLGDDVLGDDPTVAELESLAAQTTGHEAAVFVPSGTMGNQIAIATHTRPGDSVLCEDEAHILYYEVGAPAVLNGVTLRTVTTENGVVPPEALSKRILPGSLHTPGTTLLCFENSHNRAGGSVTPVELHQKYREFADETRLKIHLDGARVFNAAVALSVPVREITSLVDSVSFCLSKGLGAPVGSVLTGSKEFIEAARLWRKRSGGGMRQSGLLAAAGIYALNHHVEVLGEDHRRAKALANALNDLPGIVPVLPETNILMVKTEQPALKWTEALELHGIRCFPMDPHRIRLVFHLDVDDQGLDQTIEAFGKLAREFA